ncbi:MAG: response regulator, partial [Deltaproteobacteria bacterium]|nr:response regulator [Deltaproteobacteria bacterium]
MNKARILIVEDEAIIAMEIENQLQGLGYEVTSIVDTGEKAIKKTEVDKPDLMLMDIRIKGEMDGIDTAEVIRSRFGIPVIFSTAYLDEERIERAKITMPFGYVLKPIQERDLKVTIEMALYVAKVDKERKRVTQKMEDAFEMISRAEQIAKMGSWSWNPNTNRVEWSDNMCRLYGIEPSEFDPTFDYASRYTHPDDLDFVNKFVESLLTEKKPQPPSEYRILTPENEIVWIEGTTEVLLNDKGDIEVVVGTVQDITERKQKDEEILKTKDELQKIIDSSMSNISVKDLDGSYILVNQKFLKEFGVAKDEFIGKTDFDFLPKGFADKYREQDRKIEKTG